MTMLLPNTFQHHNFYIDKLAYFITSEEEKVLNKAIREILGWSDERLITRSAHIALSVFYDGKSNKNGEQLCCGCGLSLNTIRKALVSLDRYNILVKVGEPVHDGQKYALNIDSDKIDWEGLKKRRYKWADKNKKRTEKATIRRLENQRNPQGVTSDDSQGVTSDDSQGVTSDDSQGVTSDDNKETQKETQMKPIRARDFLIDVLETGQNPQATEPSDFDKYFGKYRDDILNIYQQTFGRHPNPGHKEALIELSRQPWFTPETFGEFLPAYNRAGGYPYDIERIETEYRDFRTNGKRPGKKQFNKTNQDQSQANNAVKVDKDGGMFL